MPIRVWCCYVLLVAFASPVCAELLLGRVIHVVDGDTVTIIDNGHRQHSVRLMGIDAPEKQQPFGMQSKEHLAGLVNRQHVTVEWFKRDSRERLIGKLMLDGHDINLAQIRYGYAWWYRQYQREQSPQDRILYRFAEDDAKRLKTGLWQLTDPVPPWEHRRSH